MQYLQVDYGLLTYTFGTSSKFKQEWEKFCIIQLNYYIEKNINLGLYKDSSCITLFKAFFSLFLSLIKVSSSCNTTVRPIRPSNIQQGG